MNADTQPTVWEVPDDVWTLIEQVLNDVYPAKPKGHRRVNLRRVLNGIIFRLRTGCQWHQLPTQFGDDSTVHRHFQRWCQGGIMARIWAVLVEACDEPGAGDPLHPAMLRRDAGVALGDRADGARDAGRRLIAAEGSRLGRAAIEGQRVRHAMTAARLGEAALGRWCVPRLCEENST